MNREVTVTIDDEEKLLFVREKTFEQEQKGREIYNDTFNRCLKSGGILQQALGKVLEDQGIWSPEKQNELLELQTKLFEYQKTLDVGGIKLFDAKDIAVEMRKLRLEILFLGAERTNMNAQTVEGQADQARFNYLVSALLVYNTTKKLVFKDLDEYLNKANEVWAISAAEKVASLEYSYDDDFQRSLPENKFLLKYNFVDEELRFVNKEGKYVDDKGEILPDEEEVQFSPFLTDDGKPVE